jgi:hypothetical protein
MNANERIKKSLVRLTPVASALVLSWGCMLPLASKNLYQIDLNVKASRVELEQKGTLFLLSMVPISEPLDSKDVLMQLMEDEGCSDLKNIDIQYWNYSFYVISWDKVRVIADCIKAAPARPVVPPVEPAKPPVPPAP